MANVAASAVTTNEVWYDGAVQRALKCLDVNIVLSSQGDLTDSVPASIFGLRTIEEVLWFRTSASVAVGAWPSYDRTKLVFGALETNGSPTAVSVTVRGVIKGKE